MSAVVRVAVAAPVLGTFDYRVPERWQALAQPGARVIVPFGGRQIGGVVVSVPGAVEADGDRLKPIATVDEQRPPLPASLVRFLVKLADYYMAAPGELLRAALPASSAERSALVVRLTEPGRASIAARPRGLFTEVGQDADPRQTLLSRLDEMGGEAPLSRLQVARGDPALRRLRAAGLVAIDLRAPAARGSRRELVLRLVRAPGDDDAPALRRSPGRAEILRRLQCAGGEMLLGACRDVPRARAQAAALARMGLVSAEERIAQADAAGGADERPPVLTAAQSNALARIVAALDGGGFASFLLHGVTGSGKTEVYQQAIAHALAQGRSAIVLVPEISLTPQLTRRFRARFGDQVAVLHSGLGDADRRSEWSRLREGRARIALGARSAIFAPLEGPGIVVVDEEHDSSFKQEDGVRYHARDAALLRAHGAGAVVVLGSATPSLESYHAAREGRMTLLELPGRATAQALPDVEIVDLRRFRPDRDGLLSAPLGAALGENLAAGGQSILFLNRRGYDAALHCTGCGEPLRCRDCSVALTHHRARGRLLCHYCGFAVAVPRTCPACGNAGLRPLGLGTEKVEEALRARFPAARVARLDRDTASGTGLRRTVDAMREGRLDILVGTQMVTKGHDFPGVTLVGVLLADVGLGLPDFRAAERTFQLVAQVAGRAGRGARPGRVLVQTWNAQHPSIAFAARHDYPGFYEGEARVRRELGYPPFGRLVAVRVDGPDGAAVEAAALHLGRRAREAARGGPVEVLGPVEAPLARLRGRVRWQLLLRAVERGALRVVVRDVLSERVPARVRVSPDVDPVSTL